MQASLNGTLLPQSGAALTGYNSVVVLRAVSQRLV